VAVKLTQWENHPRHTSYDRSLTLKSFALAAVVAYGGLALSAFIYVPFGAQIMQFVQSYFIATAGAPKSTLSFLKFDPTGKQAAAIIQGLKGERLRNQVFAFSVTNQIINFAQEVIVPWVLEGVEGMQAKGKLKLNGAASKKKRVEWEDEQSVANLSKEDKALLEAARTETSLPDYELFGKCSLGYYARRRKGTDRISIGDYSEMITQFGYVVMWSTCWPLTPGMSLLLRV
jgi:hypothetical protein